MIRFTNSTSRLSLVLVFALVFSVFSPNVSVTQPVPVIAETKDDPTIIRTGPSEDYDRIVEAPSQIRLTVESSQNGWSKVRLSKTLSGWVESKSLTLLTGNYSPSHTVIKLVKIKHEKDSVSMEILESEPGIIVAQEWLRPPVLWLRFQNAVGALSEIEYDPKDPLISHVSMWQESEDVVSMRIDLEGLYGYQLIQKDREHLVVKFKLKSPSTSLEGWKICLDPGHGGKDTGARGPGGLEEKKVTLSIAEILGKFLSSRGAQVVFTRIADTDLADPHAPPIEELKARVEAARRSGSDLFISIHCNARPTIAEGRYARGSYVYYFQPQSFLLAHYISEWLERQIMEPKHGVIFRSFHVIRESDMPAVLIETAFISNPLTEARLGSSEYQQKIARGIFEGILRYTRSL